MTRQGSVDEREEQKSYLSTDLTGSQTSDIRVRGCVVFHLVLAHIVEIEICDFILKVNPNEPRQIIVTRRTVAIVDRTSFVSNGIVKEVSVIRPGLASQNPERP